MVYLRYLIYWLVPGSYPAVIIIFSLLLQYMWAHWAEGDRPYTSSQKDTLDLYFSFFISLLSLPTADMNTYNTADTVSLTLIKLPIKNLIYNCVGKK